MTATTLSKDAAQDWPAWSIVGICPRNGVVSHLALLAKDESVKHGGDVFVYHMGPPLTSLQPDVVANEDRPGDVTEEALRHDTIKVHVAARLEDLNDDDRAGMRRWHRRVSAFFPATTRPAWPQVWIGQEKELADFFKQCHYIAHPAYEIKRDPVSNQKESHWYSCAGFVTQCYEFSPVKQVLTAPSANGFPVVDKKTVKETFLHGLLLTPELGEALGLTGDGPWPVAMPGYVLHAFRRTDPQIRTEPYHPGADDTSFPQTE